MKKKTKTKPTKQKEKKKCLMQPKVFVVDKKERPLMPCSPRTARLLLKSGKARIFKHAYTGFFTIKLNYVPKKHYLQKNYIGVDVGTKFIGVSVRRSAKNNGKVSRACTHQYQIQLRAKEISSTLEQCSKFRRTRRNRKTRYRKARFLNRGNSKRSGIRQPSIKHQFDSHAKVVNILLSILPNAIVILEVGNFDPQLMKSEEKGQPFNRHWGYQRGVNYEFPNRKAYVLWRDDYKCQQCGKSKQGTILNVHHIVYRRRHGSNDEDNLVTLCEECHKKLHAGTITLKKSIGKGKKKTLADATQMNYIKCLLMKYYPNAKITWGYITKENRQRLGLPKEHYNDALVIASRGKPVKMETSYVTFIKRVSKGDYKLSRGKGSEQKLPVGKIQGFRKFDKVRYKGKEYFIKSKMSSGYAKLMDINGNLVKFNDKNNKTPKFSKMTRINARRSWICQTQAV